MNSSNSHETYVTKNRSVLAQWLHGKSTTKDEASLVFRMADVVRQGYLLKQGAKLKMWSRRYFILRLESHHMTLSYYTSQEDLTLCTETPIGTCHRLYDCSTEKHPNRLTLKNGTDSMMLEAEDSTSFQLWKDALEEAIRWNNAMVASSEGDELVKYGDKVSRDQALNDSKAHGESKKKPEVNKPNDCKTTYFPTTRMGHHSFTANNTKFEVPTKYKFLKTIGSGAYGVVVSAEMESTSESNVENAQVAIKNIQRAFDDLTDAKRIVREIKLMRHLQHKHLLSVLDILAPSSLNDFEDVYIISELMATDLHRVIYSRHALSNDHVAYFMYQMLCALKYIHSANVIHRDLKPSNILLNGNCELKICDFGLARGVQPDIDSDLTEYVVTRWYRAPEIMLGCMNYTKDVDVWSLGCIFAEMVARKPLFPGQDYIDQLHLIMNTLGALPLEDLQFLTNSRAKKFMTTEFHKRGQRPSKPLRGFFKDIDSDALDLMQKMLIIDPNKRISVDEALGHPYFASIRTISEENVAETPFNFDFEENELEKSELQRLIWEEIVELHPELGSDNNSSSATNSGLANDAPFEIAKSHSNTASPVEGPLKQPTTKNLRIAAASP